MSARIRFWLITLAALLGLASTLALGCWQLGRAAQKEALQNSLDRQVALPPLDAAVLRALADPAGILHRRIVLRGRWLAPRTVFLDNRQMQGRAGFYVLTPLALEAGAGLVLIQRGWVARNFVDRAQLPVIQTPDGVVEIEGRIAPAPAKLYEFADAQTGPIRQNLDLGRFSTELGTALLPVTVQQTAAASEGLLREWPRPGSGVDKHLGYAFQWFGLSALIAILYVWFQIVRRFIRPRRA